MSIRPLLLILALVLVACATTTRREDIARHDAFVQAVKDAEPCDEVDFRAILGEGWDRAVFLGPYATNEGAKAALGFDFDVEEVSPWAGTEGGVVVVLAKGQGLDAWFSLSTAESGLRVADYANIEASELHFTVVDDAAGGRELLGIDPGAC